MECSCCRSRCPGRTGPPFPGGGPIRSDRSSCCSHPELLGLAGVSFLAQLAHESLPAAFVIYASYRYHWDQGTIGLSLAVVGICSAVVQGGLIGPIVARLGERRAMMFGLGAGAIGFAIYGFAATATMFWVGVPLMAL